MPTLRLPHGDIDYLVTGAGEPVTVFAHGLGASIAETRPLGSGVDGTRVFFHFRGHGETRVHGGSWDYRGLVADLLGVADAFGATRALGVSMGAGALMAILAEQPDRFERSVFFLPAALDSPRRETRTGRLDALVTAVEQEDVDWLAELLGHDLPPEVLSRRGVATVVRGRAALLAGTEVSRLLTGLQHSMPLADRRALGRVRVPTLVVGQDGDVVHRPHVARELAAALPNSRLHLFTDPAAIWVRRTELRSLLAGFLNAD